MVDGWIQREQRFRITMENYNYFRHVRRCVGGRRWWAGFGRSVASVANFARHQDRCRVWDPGGGPRL